MVDPIRPIINNPIPLSRAPQNRIASVLRVRSTNRDTWPVAAMTPQAPRGTQTARETSSTPEYLYVDFGNGPTIALSPAFTLTTNHLTDNIGRVGVNMRF